MAKTYDGDLDKKFKGKKTKFGEDEDDTGNESIDVNAGRQASKQASKQEERGRGEGEGESPNQETEGYRDMAAISAGSHGERPPGLASASSGAHRSAIRVEHSDPQR